MVKSENFIKLAKQEVVQYDTIRDDYHVFVINNNLTHNIPGMTFEPRVSSNVRVEETDDNDSQQSRKSRNSFSSCYANSSIASYTKKMTMNQKQEITTRQHR